MSNKNQKEPMKLPRLTEKDFPLSDFQLKESDKDLNFNFYRFLSLLILVLTVIFSFLLNHRVNLKDIFDISKQEGEGKLVLITGATSGLGLSATQSILNLGSSVILASRNITKCEEIKEKLIKNNKNKFENRIFCEEVDVSNFKSIKKFVKKFQNEYEDQIDVLINNAGIMAVDKFTLSLDGYELQFATNHLGHFLLTGLLYSAIKPGGRIINHSSGAYLFSYSNYVSNLDYFLTNSTSYSPWTAYGNSKLANLQFTYELNRRLAKIGNPKKITAYAVHPGFSNTNLFEESSLFKFNSWKKFQNLFAMSSHGGSLPMVYTALSKDAQPNERSFYGPRFVIRGAPALTPTLPFAWNEEQCKLLWEKSSKIVGFSYL